MILLTLCHVESTSDSVGHAQALQEEVTSTGNLAVLHSPDDELHWLPLPGCASPWIVIGTSLDVTSSLPSSFTPST